MDKSSDHHFYQEIKCNIINKGANSIHVTPGNVYEDINILGGQYYYVICLAKPFNLNLIMRKQPDKPN